MRSEDSNPIKWKKHRKCMRNDMFKNPGFRVETHLCEKVCEHLGNSKEGCWLWLGLFEPFDALQHAVSGVEMLVDLRDFTLRIRCCASALETSRV